jgi:hypothetical protein
MFKYEFDNHTTLQRIDLIETKFYDFCRDNDEQFDCDDCPYQKACDFVFNFKHFLITGKLF